jgi:hypothetical protein
MHSYASKLQSYKNKRVQSYDVQSASKLFNVVVYCNGSSEEIVLQFLWRLPYSRMWCHVLWYLRLHTSGLLLDALVTIYQTGEHLTPNIDRPENLTSHIATSIVQDNLKQMYAQSCLPRRSVFLNVRPCSPVKLNWRFGGTCRFHLQDRRESQTRNHASSFMLVSCLAYSSTLTTGAICSFEMSLDFHRNTRFCNSEDISLYNHRCGNLKSNMSDCCSESRFCFCELCSVLMILVSPFETWNKTVAAPCPVLIARLNVVSGNRFCLPKIWTRYLRLEKCSMYPRFTYVLSELADVLIHYETAWS